MVKPCFKPRVKPWFGPSNPAITSKGGTPPGPISEMAQNGLPGAAFCKGKLCSGNKPHPSAAWLKIAALA